MRDQLESGTKAKGESDLGLSRLLLGLGESGYREPGKGGTL